MHRGLRAEGLAQPTSKKGRGRGPAKAKPVIVETSSDEDFERITELFESDSEKVDEISEHRSDKKEGQFDEISEHRSDKKEGQFDEISEYTAPEGLGVEMIPLRQSGRKRRKVKDPDFTPY